MKQGLSCDMGITLRYGDYLAKRALSRETGIIVYIIFHYINVGHNGLFITPNVHIMYGSDVFIV